MRKRATSMALGDDAQQALERLSLADIHSALSAMPKRADILSDEHLEAIFEQAERARFKDEMLDSTILPAHLYVVDAIQQVREMTGPLLECLMSAVRAMVSRNALSPLRPH